MVVVDGTNVSRENVAVLFSWCRVPDNVASELKKNLLQLILNFFQSEIKLEYSNTLFLKPTHLLPQFHRTDVKVHYM